jgi:hypothetical protein
MLAFLKALALDQHEGFFQNSKESSIDQEQNLASTFYINGMEIHDKVFGMWESKCPNVDPENSSIQIIML